MEKTAIDPTEYLQSLESDFKTDLIKLDNTISKIMIGQSRVLWQGIFWSGSEQNIIGYGEMSYNNSSGKNVEWFGIGLAEQKNYISLYVNAVDGNQYLAQKYKGKLGKVKVGKSSVSFKTLDDIDLNALEEFLTIAMKILKK